MELKRDYDGFIDIDYLIDNKYAKLINRDSSFSKFWFSFDKDEYFYKSEKHVEFIYNELIAEELAKDFDIPCAHYDIAAYDGNIGVISKNIFKKDDNKFSLSEILDSSEHNNLEDIWDTFLYRYKDEKIVERLMKEIVDVFMFDVLIANPDRHSGNIMITENKDKISVAPLYDNMLMLSSNSIRYGMYSIGIDREDYNEEIDEDENMNLLFRFLNVSDNIYKEIFESKLWVISPENIDKVIVRVENRINNEIPDYVKEFVKEQFVYNNRCINDVLLRIKQKKAGLLCKK